MRSLGKNAPLYILALVTLVTIIILIVMLTKKKSDFGSLKLSTITMPISNLRTLLTRANNSLPRGNFDNYSNLANNLAPTYKNEIQQKLTQIEDKLIERKRKYPYALCCFDGPMFEWEFQNRLSSYIQFAKTILRVIDEAVVIINRDLSAAQNALSTFKSAIATAQNVANTSGTNNTAVKNQITALTNAINTYQTRMSTLLQVDYRVWTYTSAPFPMPQM